MPLASVVLQPCPTVTIHSAERLELSAAEIRLLCGDPHSPAWQDVPGPQAAFLLRSFLQERGYYHAKIDAKPKGLTAETGAPTPVSKVSAAGAPQAVDLARFWLPGSPPLSPKVLDTTESWMRDRLRHEGYGCPVVTSKADPDSGAITLNVAPGARQLIARVVEEPVEGLLPGVLRRNDAFQVGDVYDGDNVALTERRTVGQQLVFSTRFTTACEPEGVVLTQKSVAGPARLTSLGAGFNTERLALFKATLRNSRLGDTASVADLSGSVSRDEQDVNASVDWYVLRQPSRFFLRPSALLANDKEPAYVIWEGKGRIALGGTYDTSALGATFTAGPSYDVVETRKGPGPDFVKIIGWDGDVQVKSHDYEYFAGAPRQGFLLTGNGTWTKRSWHSQVEASRLSLRGETLWNILPRDPPLLVGGLRGGAATTLVGGPGDAAKLPPTYRHYLGGASTVRGFSRQSLPNDGGALSAAFAGAELRLVNLVPYGLQPFVFEDAGQTGAEPAELQGPLFLSPGAGLRWQSPVGPMRLTAAHGSIMGALPPSEAPKTRWNFYFAFGEEF